MPTFASPRTPREAAAALVHQLVLAGAVQQLHPAAHDTQHRRGPRRARPRQSHQPRQGSTSPPSTSPTCGRWRASSPAPPPSPACKAPVWPSRRPRSHRSGESPRKAQSSTSRCASAATCPPSTPPRFRDAAILGARPRRPQVPQAATSALSMRSAPIPTRPADFAARTAITGPAMGLGTVPAAPGLNTCHRQGGATSFTTSSASHPSSASSGTAIA
jgi:hypothetical protein